MVGASTEKPVGFPFERGDAFPATLDSVAKQRTQRWWRGMTQALVLAGVALGLGDATVGVRPSEAQAGIVVSASDDPYALARGSEKSGLFRGPGLGGSLSVFVTFDGVNGRETMFFGTAAAYNQYGAIATGHQFSQFLDKNLSVAVSDGANYLTDPGTLYNVSDLFIYPGYTDENSRFTNPDIAVLRYASPVNQSAQMVIADSTPLPDAPLNWAGFGQPGSVSGGYLANDGAARGGKSYVSTFEPPGGESPYFYVTTTMFFGSDELRPAPGDSGSPIYNEDGQLVGIYTRGSTSTSIPICLYANLTRPELREFVNGHLSVVTPEPSPLIMGVTGGTLCLFAARRRRKRCED